MSEKKSSVWDRLTILQKLKNIKHIEFIIISIFLVILAIIFFSSNTDSKKNETSISGFDIAQYAQILEKRLSVVLSEINGAGRVTVMITLDGGMSYEYATESEEVTTSSSITSGTNSKTTKSESVVIVTQNGKSSPLVVKEIYPGIAGVVVVCSGAGSVAVKLDIINAITTLLDVDDSKVQVLVGN